MPRKKSGIPKKRTTPTVTVATHLPEDPSALALHCAAGWAAIAKDTVHFANVVPAAPVIPNDIAALNLALGNAEGGSPAETAVVLSTADKLRQDYRLLGMSVQGILRAGAVEDVATILANILMYPSNIGKRQPKAPIEVKQPPSFPSGSVRVIALAIAGALTYYYESSLDQATWTAFTWGTSETVLSGLTPGKTYYFRLRAFVRGNTLSAYTQTVSFMVR